MKTWNKTDSIVLSICLLILGIAFYFLYLESRPGDRRQGKVVGEISFKYRVAQRKLSNSMIWNDVEQNFPAYNYDSIRTDKKSEAIIRIKDKTTKIELDPNSMFLIIVEDDRVIFDLKQGSFYIKNTGKNRVEKLSVRTGDYLGNLQEGEFRIHHNEERTIFHALQGILEFFIDGQKGTVQKGETYEIRNKQISKLEHSIELKIPFDNARFFYDNNSQEVSFSWNAGNADQECVFILSEDRDFSKIIHKEISKNTSFRVSLTEGIYYWKVIYKDGGQGSMVHKLRLIQKPVVELLSPKNKEKFFFFEDKASVYFHWLPSKLYTYHILEISKNINFDIIEKKVKLERDSIRIFL
ncbi:MAG: FecR domain-containing protein, partial [Leptospiraceae bacterium]|nr:FecR domain-containing protein [Leptospiraceae bacterium]